MTLIKQWIDSAAALWDEAPYLEDAGGGGTLTFAGLQRASRAWARTLDRAGIPPGARVALRLPDPVEYACALVAIIGAGRVVVPLDPDAPMTSLTTGLKVAQPEAIVAYGPHPGLSVLPPPPPDEENLPAGPSSVSPGPVSPGAVSAGTMSPAGGIFLSTSGTSGTPKGVLLHDSQLSHVAMCVAVHHRLTPADRGYCCLPLFHVNAKVVGLLATLAARACLVLDRKFSRRGFWPMIEKQEITWINAVPAIISILSLDTATPDTAGAAPTPRGVRFVRSASAPLPPAALHRFEQAFGIPIVETYGMTEAASMITANPLTGLRKPGSAGRPPPPMSVSRPQATWRSSTPPARPSPSAASRSGAPGSSPNTSPAPHPAPSPPTAGSTPATSATSTATATCSWPAAPTTSSTAAARRSTPEKSKTSCSPSPASAPSRSSASTTTSWANAPSLT